MLFQLFYLGFQGSGRTIRSRQKSVATELIARDKFRCGSWKSVPFQIKFHVLFQKPFIDISRSLGDVQHSPPREPRAALRRDRREKHLDREAPLAVSSFRFE